MSETQAGWVPISDESLRDVTFWLANEQVSVVAAKHRPIDLIRGLIARLEQVEAVAELRLQTMFSLQADLDRAEAEHG